MTRTTDAPNRVLTLETLTEADLPLVADTEKRAYTHPWSLGNFRDSLKSGYPAHLLTTPVLEQDAPLQRTRSGRMLLGYWVAMDVLDEVHLLNLVVAPEHRRMGWGKVLLRTLALHSLNRRAHSLWLEVRDSNAPAQALYRQMGFKALGRRKGYYPAGHGKREDAVLMNLDLTSTRLADPDALPLPAVPPALT